MKLRGLHLQNVRKFGSKTATITGIGDGITVVSEANEFGKSTFFDAIYALFFEKYSSSAKQVKSLQPYSGGSVSIAADIEIEAGLFRVEKKFLTKKSAKIIRLNDQTVVAQDDEAERWISSILGNSGEGPAGLLWVRQGQVGLGTEGTKEKPELLETRRDLLSSIAGEIDVMTGGRRMDRVQSRVEDDLKPLGIKISNKGSWKDAHEKVQVLGVELAELETKLSKLSDALTQRKSDEELLIKINNPEAQKRRLDAHRNAVALVQKAEAHLATIHTATQRCELAQLRSKSASEQLADFIKLQQELDTTSEQVSGLDKIAKEANADVEKLEQSLLSQTSSLKVATDNTHAAYQKLDVTRKQLDARKAKSASDIITKQIENCEKEARNKSDAEALINKYHAAVSALPKAEELGNSSAKLEAILLSQTPVLKITYSGTTTVLVEGEILADGKPVSIKKLTKIEIPNVGELEISSPSIDTDMDKEFAAVKSALENLLKEAGVNSVSELREINNKYLAAISARLTAEALLSVMAPNGLEALRTDKSSLDLRAELVNDQPIEDIVDLESFHITASEVEKALRTGVEKSREMLNSAKQDSALAKLQFQNAAGSLRSCQEKLGSVVDQDVTKRKLVDADKVESHELTEALGSLKLLQDECPDLDTAQAELHRADDALKTVEESKRDLEKRIAVLSTQITGLAGEGVEERRDELKEKLILVQTAEKRIANQVAALLRLKSALDAERTAAREAYFEPIQEELKPLLSIIHSGAGISFDTDSLLPSGLSRGSDQEQLSDLSGGTKEQIAILTRLAFARLFARQGKHMPIILDDALVYSDDDRIVKMFTALTRVSQKQQIIVFSCRQLAFQDLGGIRPHVEIKDI